MLSYILVFSSVLSKEKMNVPVLQSYNIKFWTLSGRIRHSVFYWSRIKWLSKRNVIWKWGSNKGPVVYGARSWKW